jgi:hypothetical protein
VARHTTRHVKPSPASSEAASPSESSPSEEPAAPEQSESGSSKEENALSPPAVVKPPPVKHVWVIALPQESLDAAQSKPDSQPYLAKQLIPEGTLLRDYELTGPSELSNEIAVLAGQGVNAEIEQNCPTYSELQPPTINAANGLAEGVGCVYPKQVQTLAGELTDAGLSWRAYVRGLQPAQPTQTQPGQTPPAQGGEVTCRHPQLSEADPNHAPDATDPYATYSNPFVYFDSLLEGGACASDDVDLSRLTGDLGTSVTPPPSLSWIAPGACVPTTSSPCTAASQADETDSFLKQTIPEILADPAYKQSGLIAIVPVSAPGSASPSGSTSSGSTSPGSSPQTDEAPLGALLISPFVLAKASSGESFNDFSLSKSLARLYGVLPLGHANASTVGLFGAGVYRTTEKAAQAASPPTGG